MGLLELYRETKGFDRISGDPMVVGSANGSTQIGCRFYLFKKKNGYFHSFSTYSHMYRQNVINKTYYPKLCILVLS